MEATPMQVWRVQHGDQVAYYADLGGRPGRQLFVEGPLTMTPTKEQLATVQIAEHLGRIAAVLDRMADQMPALNMNGELVVKAEVIGGDGDVGATL